MRKAIALPRCFQRLRLKFPSNDQAFCHARIGRKRHVFALSLAAMLKLTVNLCIRLQASSESLATMKTSGKQIRGKTKASTPPGFSLRSANASKSGGHIPRDRDSRCSFFKGIHAFAMSVWSLSAVSNAAKAGSKCTLRMRCFFGISRKRRIHDYQVKALVGYINGDMGGGFFTDAAGAEGRIAGVEQFGHPSVAGVPGSRSSPCRPAGDRRAWYRGGSCQRLPRALHPRAWSR